MEKPWRSFVVSRFEPFATQLFAGGVRQRGSEFSLVTLRAGGPVARSAQWGTRVCHALVRRWRYELLWSIGFLPDMMRNCDMCMEPATFRVCGRCLALRGNHGLVRHCRHRQQHAILRPNRLHSGRGLRSGCLDHVAPDRPGGPTRLLIDHGHRALYRAGAHLRERAPDPPCPSQRAFVVLPDPRHARVRRA